MEKEVTWEEARKSKNRMDDEKAAKMNSFHRKEVR
jgi:hypothetical protein